MTVSVRIGEMGVPPVWKSYKKEYPHSYAFGAFPVMELLLARPESALAVLVCRSFADAGGFGAMAELCDRHNVPVTVDDRAVRRLAPKGNCFAAGVFAKAYIPPDAAASHVVLAQPGDMGNLGTIVRTMAAFGITDLGILRPAADLFDPKTVRASMGAVFRLRCAYFDDYNAYTAAFPGRRSIPFMLDGAESAHTLSGTTPPVTLIFGSEGGGLAPSYAAVGTPVRIPHTDAVDSLNLPVAVAVALYELTKNNFMGGESI